MTLHLVEGPAGSGKSQHARDMKQSGQVDLVADVTSLWAAVGQYERDPITGKYSVRRDDDPALGAALYLQTTVAAYGLRQGLNVVATTSRRNQAGRWSELAEKHGTNLSVTTIDPGEEVAAARLAEPDGSLSSDCAAALRLWY